MFHFRALSLSIPRGGLAVKTRNMCSLVIIGVQCIIVLVLDLMYSVEQIRFGRLQRVVVAGAGPDHAGQKVVPTSPHANPFKPLQRHGRLGIVTPVLVRSPPLSFVLKILASRTFPAARTNFSVYHQICLG